MSTANRGRRGVLLTLLIVGLALVTAIVLVIRAQLAEPLPQLTIKVLSSPAEAVTGSSARIRVTAPGGQTLDQVRVVLNDADITSKLTVSDGGLEGVVDGLVESNNTLRATAPDRKDTLLTLVNHPITGPMLSGRQQAPFVCDLKSFETASGRGLTANDSSGCSIKPRADYVYWSKPQAKFRALNGAALTNPAKRPTDLDVVTLADKTVVPFIVRVETVTIDRGVAEIAILDDPATTSYRGWNRKLVYGFEDGGGCGGGYQQGRRSFDVLSNNLLSLGFAVASNSLNVTSQNCNDVLAAEAFAMTREYFVKQYGLPIYTMGTGCSGGAAQAYQTADNYPGLLDGIVVGCSLADIGFDLGQLTFDARLLSNYARRQPGALSSVELGAVAGVDSGRRLTAMSDQASLHDPANSLGAALKDQQRYDAKTNRDGARSSVWDQSVNIYGANAEGETNRPVGNVGVQYGLQAFRNGTISLNQFLALNAEIGGLSADLKPTADRTRASDSATRQAYSTGRLLNGGGGLSTIPIIDYRAHSYGPGEESLDLRLHTFVIEQRLTEANGDANNQVRLTDSGHGRFDLERGVVSEAIGQMDRWLLAIAESPYEGHNAVVQSKPADLVDACFLPDGTRIAEPQVFFEKTKCNEVYPATWTPRMVAGGPLSSDVISCALKPPDPADYFPKTLTTKEIDRIESLFPDGVCDWSRVGIDQQPPSGPWQRY